MLIFYTLLFKFCKYFFGKTGKFNNQHKLMMRDKRKKHRKTGIRLNASAWTLLLHKPTLRIDCESYEDLIELLELKIC